MIKPTAAPTCFLCRSAESNIVQTLHLNELLSLWHLEGVRLSNEALGNVARVETIDLFRCVRCGFEFFNPDFQGGPRFYSELQAQMSGYYAPSRPENKRNADFAAKHDFHNILDIGCGTGLALDVARAMGLQTYGIEFNSGAAAEARSKGHTIFSTALEELDADWQSKLDLISLNQLLEHVADPVKLLKSCRRYLSPRGVIAIAVPSSEGVLRWHPWMALNWPPHHLSRWRQRDFYTLSEKCELALIKNGGNQLSGRELEDILLANRNHCVALGKRYRGPSVAIIRLLGFTYRKTGMKYLFRSQGHSIFCFLSRK